MRDATPVHNVVCDLLGGEMLPLHIDWYTTISISGPWGAVYTEGWDPASRVRRRRRQSDQADHQLHTHLSAAHRGLRDDIFASRRACRADTAANRSGSVNLHGPQN
ncbi:hypothetical protein ACFFYR_36195 [Paraburkholderia dipogonis]|uniref:hypothetical protein n=1 Tax=Paraburkholderia dipogonis TaxID=1211383 RepID=UPI0035EDEEEB